MDDKKFLSQFSKEQCEHLYEMFDKSIHDMSYALSVLDTLSDLSCEKENIEPACSSRKDFD